MSKVLKAEEIKQMKSSLFQQGYKLVSEAGCNVFIKVTDCQSSQYYGSIGLLMEYASDSGMTLTPADTLVDGKSGLPVRGNIQHNAPPKTPDQFNLASVSESDLISTAAMPSRHKHTPAQTSELNEAIQKCITILDEDHLGETIEVLTEDTFYNNEVDRISNDSDNDNQNIADDESDSECGENNQDNATMKSKQEAIQDNEKPKFGENSMEWSLTFDQQCALSSTHTDESVSPKKRKQIQTVEETRTILLTKHPNSDLYVYSGRNADDMNVDHSYFKKSSSESDDLEQCDSVTDTDTPLDVSGETQANHIMGKTQTVRSENFVPQQMDEELEKTCVVIEEPVLMENSLLQPGELNSDSKTLKVHKTNKSVDGKRPFVCQTCNASYGLKKSLVKHVKAEHSESDPYRCQVCGRGFRRSTALLRHKRSQHPESVRFSCRLCPAKFPLQSELRAHKATHKELDDLKCAVCQICLSSRNMLKIHLEREHPDAPPLTDKKNEIPRENHKFYCDLCKRGYMRKMTFERHIQTHEREKVTFSCSLCDKTYMREDSLRIHMQKVHPGSVKYSCHVCIAKFNTWNELRKHKEIHKVNGRIRFKCHICDKAFYHRTEMLYHVKVKHLGLSLPRSICHVCGKMLKTEVCLKSHMKFVHGSEAKSVKNYKCLWCGQLFVSKAQLSVHTRSQHTNDKSLQCTVCPQAFVRKCDLETHVRDAHTDRDSCTCEICGLVADSQHSLQVHVSQSHREKMVLCQICGEISKSKGDHRNHVELVHKRDRKHACRFCHKKYKTAAYLKVHEGIHTGVNRYKCSECSYGTNFHHNMQVHAKVHLK